MKLNIKSKYIVITGVIFILLIFLHSIKILDPLESLIFKTLTPIQKYLYTTGLSLKKNIKIIKYKKDPGEIEILKAQIRSLSLQNSKLKLLGEENKILKKELGFTKANNYTLIPAKVIGYDSLQNSTMLIIQIESSINPSKELKSGMPVIAEDGILIGKISSINNNQIFIEPLTSSKSAVAATIINLGYTTGIVEGELNLSFKMKMIPQSESIKAGDLVVSSGLESNIPKGLLIGTVSKVSHDTDTPFQTAYLDPLIDFKNLSNLLIIKDY